MIYIVEDDSAIRELEQYALQSNGYEAVGFESSEPFWQAVHTAPPELVILDVMRRHNCKNFVFSSRTSLKTPRHKLCCL